MTSNVTMAHQIIIIVWYYFYYFIMIWTLKMQTMCQRHRAYLCVFEFLCRFVSHLGLYHGYYHYLLVWSTDLCLLSLCCHTSRWLSSVLQNTLWVRDHCVALRHGGRPEWGTSFIIVQIFAFNNICCFTAI